MGHLKAILIFLLLVLTSAFYSIKVLFRWGDTSLNREFNLSFSKVALWIAGVKVKVLNPQGINARRPAVLIGNHQSGMDFAVIGSLCPPDTVVIGKREIIYIPFLGWFLLGAGNILIDRSKSRKARSALLNAIQTMKTKNLNLAIMPEGTRNRQDSTQLLPFKKGAFNLAIEAQFPIIPVVCSSLEGIAILEKSQIKGGRVIVSVMEPVETVGLTLQDVHRLSDEIRGKMQIELNRINTLVMQNDPA